MLCARLSRAWSKGTGIATQNRGVRRVEDQGRGKVGMVDHDQKRWGGEGSKKERKGVDSITPK